MNATRFPSPTLSSPVTRTGEIASPRATGEMLVRLTDSSLVRTAVSSGESRARRETFRPRRREAVLLWIATGSLALTSGTLVAGVLLVR